MNPEIAAKITSICTSPGSHYSTFVSIVHKYLRKIAEEYWLFIIFILIFLETIQDGLMTFRNSVFPNYKSFLLRCTNSSSDEFSYFESMVLTQKLKLRFCWRYEIFHCISSCSLKEKVCMCFLLFLFFCFVFHLFIRLPSNFVMWSSIGLLIFYLYLGCLSIPRSFACHAYTLMKVLQILLFIYYWYIIFSYLQSPQHNGMHLSS